MGFFGIERCDFLKFLTGYCNNHRVKCSYQLPYVFLQETGSGGKGVNSFSTISS